MKTPRTLFAIFAVALSFLVIFSILSPCPAKKIEEITPGGSNDTRTLIQSVDAANQTVTIISMQSNLTHAYKIDDGTMITVSDNRGKFADLKAGLQVRDYKERDSATLDAISVSPADPAPPPPPTTPKKPKKPAAT